MPRRRARPGGEMDFQVRHCLRHWHRDAARGGDGEAAVAAAAGGRQACERGRKGHSARAGPMHHQHIRPMRIPPAGAFRCPLATAPANPN
jgi:hypothetical protein